MKTAIYPGSFNPWHEAHLHILTKALTVFDKVYVARGINGNKPISEYPLLGMGLERLKLWYFRLFP